MGVYRRRDSPWYWLYLERPGGRGIREKSGIPKDAPTASERKALRELADAAYRVRMAQLARGTYDLPGSRPAITFDKYADWYETHVSAHQAGRDRELGILAQLRNESGPLLLEALTKDRVREWMTRRSRAVRYRTVGDEVVAVPIAVGTVNRELDLLKSMLREACPTYLEASPIAGLRRLKPPQSTEADAEDDEIRILAHEEEVRLLAVLAPADQVLVIAAIDTLARLGSLLALTWRDVSGDAVRLRRTKNGKTYRVPMSTRLRAALDGMTDRHDTYVFQHRRLAKKPRDWRGIVGNMLERGCVKAGVPFGRALGGITFHSLRHTGASRMIAKGTDLRTVQELGGWSDIRLLMRYVHPSDEAKRRAVEAASSSLARDAAPTWRHGPSYGSQAPQAGPLAFLVTSRMDGVRSIPTWYGGVHFRSRLEARWAAFFDRVGWPWLYEPIEYAGWIPDFVLSFPHAPLFVEVKPFDRPRRDELEPYQVKIDRAGCPHEVLLVGGCGPWPEGAGAPGDAVIVGLMRAASCAGGTWGVGLLTGCRAHMRPDRRCPEPTGSVGVFLRDEGTCAYVNRRCGCRGEDHHMDRVEWHEVWLPWRLAGNVVQWRPDRRASTAVQRKRTGPTHRDRLAEVCV